MDSRIYCQKHLQQNNQNILEAASLAKRTMHTLKLLRDCGFSSLMEDAISFFHKHKTPMVEISDFYVTQRRHNTNFKNQHHFEYDVFNTVMDMQNQEFMNRFSEVSTNLLDYMSALSPCNSFSMFDKSKLVKLSGLYKADFNDLEMSYLESQLETYYHSLIIGERFTNLKGIADLSRLLVETGKDRSFPLVYRLVKLTLVLPVATATVERCFSAMKLLKTDLRNRIGDDFMNDALICSVEKQALIDVKIEDVMARFRKIGLRKG